MSGAAETQQLRKGHRPETAATLNKSNVNEALTHTIKLEIVKRVVDLLSGFEKGVLRHCGGTGHRPSERRDYPHVESQ
jgi:hypothetical protein